MYEQADEEKTMYEQADDEKENSKRDSIQKDYEQAITALHLALTSFDLVGVENFINTGLRIHDVLLDPRKYRNCLHELVISYATRPLTERSQNDKLKFIDILTVLLQNGLDIDDRDVYGQTVLHLACSSEGSSEIIRILLASGVDVNQQDVNRQSALHHVTNNGKLLDLQTLLDGGADPNTLDQRGYTPLHIAAKRKNGGEFIRSLAGCGASVDAHIKSRSIRGPAPLHMAARHGRRENVKVLLRMGARVDIGDSSGQTPLHVAAAHDMTGKTVLALLKAGAGTNHHDSLYRETPLHKAVKANRAINIIHLLGFKANPNIQDDQRETPLHVAAAGCSDMLIWRHLLKARGDPTIMNRNGQTPYEKATKEKNMTALAMMKQYDQRLT